LKVVSLIILFFFGSSILAQNQRFFDLLDRTEKTAYEDRAPLKEPIEIIDFDLQKYEEIVFNTINKERRLKRFPLLKQDLAFNQVCNAMIKHTQRKLLTQNGARSGKMKHLADLGLRHFRGENRVFTMYSFYTNLTHLSKFKSFHYDRKGPEGEVNLYMGKNRKKYKNGIPEVTEKKPVKVILETEWTKLILKYFKKRGNQFGIRNREYSHIGIATRINEYTINRSKIPFAFVMVIIGGKQTQEIAPPKSRKYRAIADSTLYELLLR